ncbi:hypothetical protein C8J56DRAFT_1030695 [Mycena floridula]|nr:hypothetical protein C8J56DRAFT_1030695 [Mycena floridula]
MEAGFKPLRHTVTGPIISPKINRLFRFARCQPWQRYSLNESIMTREENDFGITASEDFQRKICENEEKGLMLSLSASPLRIVIRFASQHPRTRTSKTERSFAAHAHGRMRKAATPLDCSWVGVGMPFFRSEGCASIPITLRRLDYTMKQLRKGLSLASQFKSFLSPFAVSLASPTRRYRGVMLSSFCGRRPLLASSPSLQEGGNCTRERTAFVSQRMMGCSILFTEEDLEDTARAESNRVVFPHDRQFSERLVELVNIGITVLVSLLEDGHELVTCSSGIISQAEIDANLGGRN